MQKLDMHAPLAALALAAMTAGSGCASTPEGSGGLPTLTADSSTVQMTGIATGTLTAELGCIRLARADGPSRLVIWPHGTRLAGQQIALPNGKAVALGQSVTLGGGERDDVPTTMLASPLSGDCKGPYFIAADRIP